MDFYHTAADLYDSTFGQAELEGERGDVAFYVEEARRAGSPVLDLACGTGRVLIRHHTNPAITDPAQLSVVYEFAP